MGNLTENKKNNVENFNTQVKEARNDDLMKMRIVVAQRLGRDQDEILHNFNRTFSGEILNEYVDSESLYKLERYDKRTKTKKAIRGLSLSVVKDLATLYKHIYFGIDVLEYRAKASAKVRVYCLDLFNNSSEERIFQIYFPDWVSNSRNWSDDSYKFLYAEASRRMRSCIERILPSWIMTKAYKIIFEAKKEAYTLSKRPKGSSILVDLVKKFTEFDSRITKKIILECLFNEDESYEPDAEGYTEIEAVYSSLKEGDSTVEECFPVLESQVVPRTERKAKKVAIPMQETKVGEL